MKTKNLCLSLLTMLFITLTSFQTLKTSSGFQNTNTAITSNLIIAFDQTLFINNTEGGEMVSFTGNLHLVTIFFPTDPLRIQSNVMNITGTGLSSGLTYKITGTDNSFDAAYPGSQFQTTHIYRILSPSPIIPTDPVRMQYTIDLDSDGFATGASAFAFIAEGL
jgi:hypothetical protein